jgi:radical SAM superfamily enzyme YgiQ (UPF0313 family)
MKLTLIILNTWHADIKNDWFGFKRRGGYAPLTLRILSSLIPKELNVEVDFRDENIERIDFDRIDADMVGISVLTPNAPRAYRISDSLRSRGITVVLGGYHVTVMPNEALNHADSVVTGYAEKSFPMLLRDFVSGNLKKTYSEPFEESFISHRPMAHNPPNYGKRYLLPDAIETTRGCNNCCNFCVIPTFNNRYVQKPVSAVVEEIRFLQSKRIVFLDFSPFENYDHAMELFDALKPLKIKWYSCLTTRVAENHELMEQAAQSGCRGVLIGFESINTSSLANGNKLFNKPHEYTKITTNLQKLKILVLGSFIFGFDEDDSTVFKNTLDFIAESKIDLLHYAIVTPFPGTKLFERLKADNRILTYDWAKYDGTRVVYTPAKMTAGELQNGFFNIYKKSHTLPSIFRRMANNQSNFMVKLATNMGFRLYINSFINHYKLEKDNLY